MLLMMVHAVIGTRADIDLPWRGEGSKQVYHSKDIQEIFFFNPERAIMKAANFDCVCNSSVFLVLIF